MSAPVIDKPEEPAPYCHIPAGYRPYVRASETDIRRTWERHVPGWQLRHRDRQPGQHGAEKP